jgi:SEC-C motif.
MNNRKEISEILDGITRLVEHMDVNEENQFNKMFYPLGHEANIKDSLSCLTKAELDTIRKSLAIKGVSKLKKNELAEVISSLFRHYIPIMLSKLTEGEYELLTNIVKNGGRVEYKDKYKQSFMYLRNYGILTGALIDARKHILIPSDIIVDLENSFNSVEIVGKIKLNEKIYRTVKGLLFYYGIINMYQLHSRLNEFLGTSLDMVSINALVEELQKKDDSIKLQDSFWCHGWVKDYNAIMDEVNKRTSLEYLPVTKDMLLEAGKEDFKEWNHFDTSLCEYLKDNFEITRDEAIEYVENLKMGFKSGDSFSNAMGSLSRSFEIRDIKAAQEIGALVQDVYNNSRQWALKGKSPYEITRMISGEAAGPLKVKGQSIAKEAPIIMKRKIGRNEQCPCGSGKKYKRCCME